ncbi:preprotein translocase subunit YajC [Catenulispora sp. EB89]|uniref:preprotein translocase subunit YajC n=1 Tax=Catenulispora sp. EB89 TaxID=3156257 RepID=UPI0035165F26
MGSPVFLIWIVLIGAMFYFMMIRPQKRARSQQSDMLQHLQPGAQVRTTAQIMGTIVEVGDDWAIVETTPGTRIKFGKPAIVGIIMDDEAEDETADEAEDAPTPGGIGDAPHGVHDAIPAQDAVPAQDAKPADADGAPAADDAVKSETDKSEKSDVEPAASEDSAEEVKDAEPAKS